MNYFQNISCCVQIQSFLINLKSWRRKNDSEYVLLISFYVFSCLQKYIAVCWIKLRIHVTFLDESALVNNSLPPSESALSENDTSSEIKLDLDNDEELSQLQQLTEAELLQMQVVQIRNITKAVPKVTELLSSSISLKLLNLHGGGYSALMFDSQEQLFTALVEVLPRVIFKIILQSFWMNQAQFEAVVRASSQTQVLILSQCRIDTDTQIDFGTDKFSIEHIHFYNTKIYSEWESASERCSNLVAGICKSKLKDSLIQANFFNYGLSVDEIKNYFEDQGASHILITNEWIDDLNF